MVRDLRAELRERKRDGRTECSHLYRPTRTKYERCENCGDHFPCKKICTHLDCGEARMELGLDFDFSDAVYEAFTMQVYDEVGRCIFDNTES